MSKAAGHFQRFNTIVRAHLHSLSHGELATWLALEAHAKPDGITSVGQTTIAKLIGRSKATVKRNMKALQAKQLLASVSKATGPGTFAVWRVLADERVAPAMPPVDDGNGCHSDDERVSSDDATGIKNNPNGCHPDELVTAVAAEQQQQQAGADAVFSECQAKAYEQLVNTGIFAERAAAIVKKHPTLTEADVVATRNAVEATGTAKNVCAVLATRLEAGDVAKPQEKRTANGHYLVYNDEIERATLEAGRQEDRQQEIVNAMVECGITKSRAGALAYQYNPDPNAIRATWARLQKCKLDSPVGLLVTLIEGGELDKPKAQKSAVATGTYRPPTAEEAARVQAAIDADLAAKQERFAVRTDPFTKEEQAAMEAAYADDESNDPAKTFGEKMKEQMAKSAGIMRKGFDGTWTPGRF